MVEAKNGPMALATGDAALTVILMEDFGENPRLTPNGAGKTMFLHPRAGLLPSFCDYGLRWSVTLPKLLDTPPKRCRRSAKSVHLCYSRDYWLTKRHFACGSEGLKEWIF